MIVLTILIGILFLLIILTIVGRFIYYYFNPENNLAGIIANAALRNQLAASGGKGLSGSSGNLNSFATNGEDGFDGKIGEIGTAAGKSLVVGPTGLKGGSGPSGMIGIPGIPGIPGLPSNSLIPYMTHVSDFDVDKKVTVVEHYFTYNDILHKLTGSFLFDNVSYFSFLQGVDSTKYKIDTTTDYQGIPLFPPGLPSTVNKLKGNTAPLITDGNPGDYYIDTSTNFLYGPKTATWPAGSLATNYDRGRNIYSTLRIVLERKTKTSDGTVFYVSPPISKDSYIIESSNNYNDLITGINKLEEITINENREFGLDFKTLKTPETLYNFLINGMLRYRCIFNIEPPIVDILPRIEERFSSKPIIDFAIPTINNPAKSNLIKLKEEKTIVPPIKDDNIYMLSPRLNTGLVVYKNSADIKNIWTVQQYTKLEYSLDFSYPSLVKAFDDLQADNESFKNELKKSISEKLINVFTPKLNTPAIITDELYTNLEIGSKNYLNDFTKFTTRMELNNLFISNSNNSSPLTYPSNLQSVRLYLKFIVRTNIKNFQNHQYHIYYENPSGTYLKKTVSESRNILIKTIYEPTSNPGTPELPIDNKDSYIYHPVNVSFSHSIDFKNFFGKKIMLKFSDSVLKFYSKPGDYVNYNYENPPGTSEDINGIPLRYGNVIPFYNEAFKSQNSGYDTTFSFIIGFDYDFEAEKFDIESDTFLVGYSLNEIDPPVYQRVIGFKERNGDYSLTIPPNGYF